MFELTLTLTDEDIDRILSLDQVITISKTVAVNGPPQPEFPVAWVAFTPDSGDNILTWEKPCTIYTNKITKVAANTRLTQSSTVPFPATLGKMYRFKHKFESPEKGTSDWYGAKNDTDDTRTFGLTQKVSLGGLLLSSEPVPLNYATVGTNQTVFFQMEERLAMFLSSTSDNGTVLANVRSDALNLEMTEGSPVKVAFDLTTNTFNRT